MKKIVLCITCVTLIFCALSVTACDNGGGNVDNGKVAEGTVLFTADDVVSTSFEGVGVDWGVYEDTNKLAVGSWDKTLAAVKRLNPSLVRCMTNLDWILYDFDDKGTADLTDDEWKYKFDNKYMKNACDILDYCQDNGIKVAFGIWNVIGNVNEELDVWKMIPNSTADPRWPKMTADLMEYLVKDKGYTCIKWFVNTNEPNYVGNKGSSKNAYNTYAKWKTGVRNVKAELNKRGLTDIDIVGGDVTASGTGFDDYLMGVASELTDVVGNYGVHLYISNYPIDKGTFYTDIKANFDKLKAVDGKIGDEHRLIIWESGLLDGKNATTDCNSYITNYSYGIRMADFTVQSLLAGVNGICYWDLDDAMHFMYTESGMTAKEWGMFSTLSSASPLRQELRPWYHSSTLISNLLRPGSTVYKATMESSETFRTVGCIAADGKSGGLIAVNRDTKAVKKTFAFTENINAGKNVYVYIFNESNLRLGSDGYVVPNAVIEGALNKGVTLELPAGSVAFISSEKL